MEAPFGLCSICGGDNLQAGDDGFFYCSICGSQSQQFQEQALDAVENQFIGAIRRAQRHTATNHISPMASIFGTHENVFPSQEGLSTQPFSQFDGTQSVYGAMEGTFSQLGSQFANMDEIPNRWDSGGGWQYESRGGVQQPLEPEKARYMLANSIRRCYCEGLQKILQFQCEALVQKFGVSPLICGIVGPIWLRYLAVSHVFEGEWAKEAIEVEEAKEDHRRNKRLRKKDYEADLPTYLKYCRDVIFSGMTMQTDEENLCNDLWRLYEKLQKKESGDEEDGKDTLEMKDVKSLEINDVNEPAFRLNEPSSSRISENSNLSFVPSRQGIRNSKQNCTAIKNASGLEGSTYCTYGEERELEEERLNSPENTEKVQRHRVLEETLQDMEEFGFKYIPPLRKSPPPNAFLRYVRGESKGSGPQRYMHADYFVLLRACAKAINVEPKALYWCSYRVENGLKWIEDKVKELMESKVLNMEESRGI